MDDGVKQSEKWSFEGVFVVFYNHKFRADVWLLADNHLYVYVKSPNWKLLDEFLQCQKYHTKTMSHHVQMAILRCCDYESQFWHYSGAYSYNWSLTSACVYVEIVGIFHF